MSASGIERQQPGGHHGVVRDIAPRRHLLAIEAPEPRTAIRRVAGRMPRHQLPVEPDTAELLAVFPDQRTLAGGQVEAIDVVPVHIAVVETDGNLVGHEARPPGRHCANVRERREVAQFQIIGVNDEQMEIFVAILIVEKHDVATVRTPGLPIDRPPLGARDRLPRRYIIDRRDPDVQDPVDRGEPRDETTIRRQLRAEKGRIVEQRSAGDQGASWHFGLCIFGCPRSSAVGHRWAGLSAIALQSCIACDWLSFQGKGARGWSAKIEMAGAKPRPWQSSNLPIVRIGL